jgi:recA bacterial DNA recombination protein
MGSPTAVKAALEDLLRNRRLHADGPPLRGEDVWARLLPTGIGEIDTLLGGGLPRGQVSEVHGPASSGRTALAVSLVAQATRTGALAAWVDPADRWDPSAAAEAGVTLARVLWLRGGTPATGGLGRVVSAAGTLLGSGLFDVVVLDLVGQTTDARRLPGATWIRLQRLIEQQPAALVLLGDAHLAHGPSGASVTLRAGLPRWSGARGPGRLLRGVAVEARSGRHLARGARFELFASS